MPDELVVIRVQKFAETDKAIFIGPPGDNVRDSLKQWLPLGLINHSDEIEDDLYELELPRWLVEKKDLEDYVVSEE